MKIMGRQKKMKSQRKDESGPFHVGLGAFVAAPAIPLPLSPSFFLYPPCLPFSHSSLGKQQRLQDRRKPRPRTARSDSLFFMQFPRFVCPRHRAPHDSFPLPPPPPAGASIPRTAAREKRLSEHENLRAPRPLRPSM